MSGVTLRPARPEDAPAIADLVERAFGRRHEADVIARLRADGEAWMQVVAEWDGAIVGQAMFYILGVRGRLSAMGLGPMSVEPWLQREGIGQAMVRWGLDVCRRSSVPIVFVLGPPRFYPKVGFSMEAAAQFQSPWSGRPEFMAVRLVQGPPSQGQLMFPKAFGC